MKMRLLDSRDEALYIRLYGDAETLRQIGPPLDAETCRRSFNAAVRANGRIPPRSRWWILCDDDSTDGFGLAGLVWGGNGDAELGVVLPPSHQGRGHASAAVRTLVARAFLDMGLERIHTRHAPAHGPAIGVMEKLGFVHRATGPGRQERCWEMRKDDWAASAAISDQEEGTG